MNVTLAVIPLGEEKNWKDEFSRYFLYFITSTIVGGLAGFIITAIIFLTTFWIPFIVKVLVLISIGTIFILHEIGILKIALPQRKWQIPSSWLQLSRTKNMIIWGLILGTGIFTYIPYTIFYILYLFIGFFFDPLYGLLFGSLYGFSRTMPTFVINSLRRVNLMNEQKVIKYIWGLKIYFRIANAVLLMLVVGYFILKILLLSFESMPA